MFENYFKDPFADVLFTHLDFNMEECARYLTTFRVNELTALLHFAGKNKVGKKCELLKRAQDLLATRDQEIIRKIKELHIRRHNPERLPLSSEQQDVLFQMQSMGATNYLPQSSYNYSSRVGHQPYTRSYHHVQYPRNPNLTFKALPYYEVLETLILPTTIILEQHMGMPANEKELHFSLSRAGHERCLYQDNIQVQMRFCALNIGHDQIDDIPANLRVKLNTYNVDLPEVLPAKRQGQEAKRPRLPIDLTKYINKTYLGPNTIYCSFTSPSPASKPPYVIAVFLVRKLTVSELMAVVRARRVVNQDLSSNFMKFNGDSDIISTGLRASLCCPLGQTRMKNPCRASTCSHPQCFDAETFLQMNERRATWTCPICYKEARFEDLVLDRIFSNIINKAPPNCTEIEFDEFCSWKPVVSLSVSKIANVKSISDDSSPVSLVKKDVPCITLSDSEDDDDDESYTNNTDSNSATIFKNEIAGTALSEQMEYTTIPGMYEPEQGNCSYSPFYVDEEELNGFNLEFQGNAAIGQERSTPIYSVHDTQHGGNSCHLISGSATVSNESNTSVSSEDICSDLNPFEFIGSDNGYKYIEANEFEENGYEVIQIED